MGAFLGSSELKDGIVLYVIFWVKKGRVFATIENPWPKKHVPTFNTGNGKKAELIAWRIAFFHTQVNEKILLKLWLLYQWDRLGAFWECKCHTLTLFF